MLEWPAHLGVRWDGFHARVVGCPKGSGVGEVSDLSYDEVGACVERRIVYVAVSRLIGVKNGAAIN